MADPINLVMGQGTMLTSPLQIADRLAAVANDGTLDCPGLMGRIGSRATAKVSRPELPGKLSISAATLASLRNAPRKVTTDRNGAAYIAFRGSKIVSGGKTGTAEVLKEGEPHA